MDITKKRNFIYSVGTAGLITALSIGTICLLAALIFVTPEKIGLYSFLMTITTICFVASVFIAVFTYQTKLKKLQIGKHNVLIYAGTKKTILKVDDKIISEVKSFSSIKKSFFYLVFRVKKLKLNTTIDNKELVVQVGAFNSLKIIYDNKKIK